MQTTAPSGNVHFAIEQTPGQLRWGLGTYTVEDGTDLFGSDFVIYAYRNSGVYFTRHVTIKRATGNMGIGTADPGTYKLAVEGTIGARKVKVTQSAWADFVFHPDYKLPSLQELESYIKMNQHLPEIPSAAEVEKEGLDLGDMNKRLLRKIEELTLYIIELKKENNNMQHNQELLQTRLEALEEHVP